AVEVPVLDQGLQARPVGPLAVEGLRRAAGAQVAENADVVGAIAVVGDRLALVGAVGLTLGARIVPGGAVDRDPEAGRPPAVAAVLAGQRRERRRRCPGAVAPDQKGGVRGIL